MSNIMSERERRNKFDLLISELETLERLAHMAEFHATGHAINNAKNAAGWEMAGDPVRAGEAGRGERPDEPKHSPPDKEIVEALEEIELAAKRDDRDFVLDLCAAALAKLRSRG